MPVIVNTLTVVHKDSGGISMAFPDPCKTPTPGGPVPIPYPNVAQSADTASGSQSVTVEGNPIMLKSSNFAMSTGDEAGSAGGVVSGKIKGKAYPKMYSFDVKVEGQNVFRLTDLMLQNGGSPTNTPPASEVQAGAAAQGGGDVKDPELFEVTKIAFARADACCGDEVEIQIDTKNAEDGDNLPIFFGRADSPTALYDSLDVRLQGSTAKPRWLVRRGEYAQAALVRAEQLFFEGVVQSQKNLEVKTAAPAGPVGKSFNRNVPKMRRHPVTNAWVPAGGTPWGWPVAYSLELKPGELVVKCRINFQLVGGAVAPKGKKLRRWTRQIEQIWDRQWKIHRRRCKRSDACDCPEKDGCCVWVVRIRAEFAAGAPNHPAVSVNLHRGANGTKESGNWWFSTEWWEAVANPASAATVRPHEFGHCFGLYDEYPEGGINPADLAHADVRSSIMNRGRRTYPRHVAAFHEWFDSKAKAVIGPTKLVRM